MKKTWLVLAVAAMLLVACGAQSGPEPTVAQPTEAAVQPAEASPPSTFAEPTAAAGMPEVTASSTQSEEKLAHGVDERIPVAAMEFGTEAIYKLLQRFGGAS